MPKNITTIADLTPDTRNANRGTPRGLQLVEDSLRRYGAGRSIVTDKEGRIIAGNKTVEAAVNAGIERLRVVETDGHELVVVQRNDLDLEKDKSARELAIVDNRAGQLGLEWYPSELDQQINDFDIKLGDIGFTDKELAILSPETFGEVVEDEVPSPDQVETRCKPGDLWKLGEHRLLCGDSTKPEDVSRVMGGDKAGLMNTDPPYGVDYAAVKNGIPDSGFQNIQERGGDIENDDLTSGPELQAFLELMIRSAVPHLTENPAFYLWHPMLTQGTFFAAAAAADILIHRQIIWVKPNMVLTRSGMYHWKHELCFYGWIRGHLPPWYGDKSQVSVWEIGESQQNREHPTQKPVELFARPMMNHTRKGEVVYEPFAGSGSQFIASEQLVRRCFGIEISPKYCDVVLTRWQKFTGQTAVKAD